MFPLQTVLNFANEYAILKSVGRGSYGNVYLLRDKVTQTNTAGKFIEVVNKDHEKRVRKEIVIIASLRHENVVEYLTSYSTPKGFIIVTKYYSGKNLYDRRMDKPHVERDVILYVSQICRALTYIHESNVVHRDLKATNVIFEAEDSQRVRIIDFGLSCKLDEENTSKKWGTKSYFAPEVIRSAPITGATDMWSLGVLTYWLLSVSYPFPGCSEQASLIEGGQYTYNASFKVVSNTARNFIDNLLVVQPELRLTASSALQHRWLRCKPANDSSSKSG